MHRRTWMDKMKRLKDVIGVTKSEFFISKHIKTIECHYSRLCRYFHLQLERYCTYTQAKVEQLRFLLWFDSNSDCNVWMTLDLLGKWNKFVDFYDALARHINGWHIIIIIILLLFMFSTNETRINQVYRSIWLHAIVNWQSNNRKTHGSVFVGCSGVE